MLFEDHIAICQDLAGSLVRRSAFRAQMRLVRWRSRSALGKCGLFRPQRDTSTLGSDTPRANSAGGTNIPLSNEPTEIGLVAPARTNNAVIMIVY